jgi:sugar transferase (PEP-CTERM system associated)
MPIVFKKYYPIRNVLFFLFEGLLIVTAVSLVGFVLEQSSSNVNDIDIIGLHVIFITLTFQLSLYYFDLYDLSLIPSIFDATTRITMALGVSCIILSLVYYIYPAIILPKRVFWSFFIVVCFAVMVSRVLYAYILNHRVFYERILILGAGDIAGKITDEIINKKDSGYRISAVVTEDESVVQRNTIPIYHDVKQLLQICKKNKIEKIITAFDDRRTKMPTKELMNCKLHDIKIVTGMTFFQQLTGRILVENINPSWIIFADGFSQGKFIKLTKRFLDIAFALLGLVLSLPIILLISLLVKVDSPGPIFYSQERVGQKGETFRLFKFRSMYTDAEADGPVWATQNDSRTTRIGRLIRKFHIDEIPQMWNILKGDMSFVGPRPERPVFVSKLEKKIPYYSLRHNIKPGLTGWAQVSFSYGSSEEDAIRKLEYDFYYLKNCTIPMDLWILFQTSKIVLLRKGAL